MLISVMSKATYELPSDSFVILMVEPHPQAPDHQLKEVKFTTSPVSFNVTGKDAAGNLQRRLIVPAGLFSFEYHAVFETAANEVVPLEAAEHPAKDLPPETLTYTLPSRYCQSDLVTRMARNEFGSVPAGGARVRAIADWVRTHVEYCYGTTTSKTSAYDTVTERVGVCRDFAHLVITFCRAMGMPARYVSAYALGLEPPDFHGITQVYLGGRWYNVDATYEGNRPALVPIALGRDAADVAMATFWGVGNLHEQSVEVKKVS